MADDNYREESKFNMALAYLKRIDMLLYMCQMSATRCDVGGWTNNLRSVYREASVRLSDEEKKEILGDYKTPIEKELTTKILSEEDSTFKNVYFLTKDLRSRKMYHNKIMFLLDGLEIKLRLKLQQRGMLLPSKSDPTKAILNM